MLTTDNTEQQLLVALFNKSTVKLSRDDWFGSLHLTGTGEWKLLIAKYIEDNN